MAKFEVKNSEGKKVAEAELAAEVYGIEPNIHVMHHIVKCQMASWRQGTQSAKGRSEVSGGGKKPWRQKGTGRARQGSIRAAQWRHGGVVFAPKPRSYAKRMNNKEVKLAMRSALSAKPGPMASSCSSTTTASRSLPPRLPLPCSRLSALRASV